ncbi:hypothetical protein HK57_00158 [Aspergillus ustus]|uniref:Uncharacterized protein n=1 Tax=Aspergillus ustus TaxID=40382 RepID=A0A0C1C2W9_ASPUT|nr:hypothetical protein HK57_00158 [Aspergillus ustus]
MPGLDGIAIVGYAFKFPSGVEDDSSFWDVLANRTNLKSDWPSSRLGYGHTVEDGPWPVAGPAGHYIAEDVRSFDAPFFSVTAKEAASMDPLQRWTLEVSYRALESAGIPAGKLAGSRTAVFSASMLEDYARMNAIDPDRIDRFAATGNGISCVIPNRAIVTGSNLLLDPSVFEALSSQGFLSPDGLCYSFDHRANGYGRGEGVIAVILKPVLAAVRDGDMIRAVIRATGSNQDGRTPVLTQPSLQSQEELIRDVYRRAGLSLDATRYVEAHGTGTPVGDPVEMAAIGRSFRKYRSHGEPLYVSSVKANIGHLEGASGLASLVKCILMLEKGVIPPTALFDKLNAEIDADGLLIEIPTRSVPWPSPGLRRISINSFGFAGSNAHIIVDDALHYLQDRQLPGNHCTAATPATVIRKSGHPGGSNDTTSQIDDDYKNLHMTHSDDTVSNDNSVTCQFGSTDAPANPKLLVWTAADEKATLRLSQAYVPFYHDLVSSTPNDLDRLAYTLSARRDQMLWRTSAVSQEGTMIAPSRPIRSSTETGLVFVFTGQGAQYAGMGVELLEYPRFVRTLERVDAIYARLGCTWSLLDALRQRDNIDRPEYAQALCMAVQIGLVEMLKGFGLVPKAVIGHSSGEIAAAYTAGALTLESACKVGYFRGKVAEKMRVQMFAAPGAMLSINLAEEQVPEYLNKVPMHGISSLLTIGCANSPLNCTLSGLESAIDAVKARADEDGIFAQKLGTGLPYHSPFMRTLSKEYLLLIGELEGCADPSTLLPMVSTVSAEPANPSTLTTAQYWVENLVSPVQFRDAVLNLAKQRQFGTFTDVVEIGPHPSLRRSIQDTLAHAKSDIRYLSTLHRSQSGVKCILELAGRLFCIGYPVSVSAVNGQESSSSLPFLINGPSYPFERLHFWVEPRLSRGFRLRGPSYKDTLGARVADWNPLAPRWRNFFSIESHPWIGDHKISDTVLYPAAGMLLMTVEAVCQMASNDRSVHGCLIEHADFLKPIIVPDGWSEHIEIQLHLHKVGQRSKRHTENSEFDVSIFACTHSGWTECYRARARAQYEHTAGVCESIQDADEQASESCIYPVDSDALYREASDHGLQYGPAFKLLEQVRWDGEHTAIASVVTTREYGTARLITPAVLDQAFHVLRVAAGQMPAANIPVRMSGAWFAAHGWYNSKHIRIVSTGAATKNGSGETGSIDVVAEDGSPLCAIKSILTSAVTGTAKPRKEEPHLLYNVEWKPQLSLLSPHALRKIFSGGSALDESMIVADHALLCDTLDVVIMQALHMANHDTVPDPLKAYVNWMERHVRKHMTALQRQEALAMSSTDLENRLSSVQNSLPAFSLYTSVARKLSSILAGEIDPLEVVFESEQARVFYAHLFHTLCGDGRLAGFLDLAVHETSALRILEIGAGTGGMTGPILAALQEREARTGAPAFALYTYTDISPAFFEQARLRWPELEAEGRLQFAVLDASRSLIDQGVALGSYDMVVAGSVLHATPDLEATVRNVRSVLAPGGYLVLLEAVNPDNVATNFIAGLIPGWWGAREDWRRQSAAISESLWDQLLRANGFSGNDLVLRDYMSDECHNMSIIISTAIVSEDLRAQEPKPRVVLVIEDTDQQRQLADIIRTHLRCSSWPCTTTLFTAEALGEGQWDSDTIVICIVELHNRPWVTNLTEESFACLKIMTRHEKLLWVTGTRPNDPEEPHYGAVQGLLRCIRAEQVDCRIVSLAIGEYSDQGLCPRVVEAVIGVAFQSPCKDVEYILRDGVLTTGRVVKDMTGQAALRRALARSPRTALEVAGSTMIAPNLGPCRVKIKVSESDTPAVGCKDCTGVATWVDSACKTLRPGDQAIIVAGERLGQYADAPEELAILLPKFISLTGARWILSHGLSAYYALVELARIRRGDRVLVQSSSAEFVHIAASIAELNGAHVFATASFEKKNGVLQVRQVAEDGLLVPDTDPVDRSSTHDTAHEHFDVVILHSPGCDNDLDIFLDLVTPGGQVVLFRSPSFTLPIHYYPQNCSVSLLDLDSLTPAIRIPEPYTFLHNASYLIVGGTGGLGRAITRWMVDRGAKHIILLSRSGASSKAAAAMVSNLRTRGVNILVFACDASCESSVATVLDRCTRTMPPIKGCINAAMVLRDAIFQENMTFAQWDLTIKSKVHTSWVLHRLLPSDLDFFILLSSLLGVTGQMGSSNYAAGCAFQDALAQHRVARGQKALSLDLGWMRDIGVIAETAAYQRQRHVTDDMQPIAARELLALLDICLDTQLFSSWKGQLLFGLRTPTDILRAGRTPPHFLATQPLLAPFAFLPGGQANGSHASHNMQESPDAQAAQLFRQSDDPEKRARVVFRALAAKLARAMFISLDDIEASKPLSSYGVDSLMAVELRNWIAREFEAAVAVFDIMGDASIGGIANLVVEKSAMCMQGLSN